MNIEDELRAALRHEPAPAEFAAKVVARSRVSPWWRTPAALAVAAGLVITVVIPPAVSKYRMERGLKAKMELLQALAITRVQIQQVKQIIQRNTRRAL